MNQLGFHGSCQPRFIFSVPLLSWQPSKAMCFIQKGVPVVLKDAFTSCLFGLVGGSVLFIEHLRLCKDIFLSREKIAAGFDLLI